MREALPKLAAIQAYSVASALLFTKSQLQTTIRIHYQFIIRGERSEQFDLKCN
jgi:hypothetical protein